MKKNTKMWNWRKYLAIISSTVLLSFCLITNIYATEISANYQVTTQAGDEVEPSVAVNPLNSDHLVMGAIDAPNASCIVRRSLDGGVTWTSGTLQFAGRDYCADPAVEFNSQGDAFFVAFLYDWSTTEQNKVNNKVAIARSTDGGLTFGAPQLIDLEGREDKPYIAIDKTGGATDGNIYVPFTLVSATNSSSRKIYISVSTDNGATFNTYPIMEAGNNWGAHPAVGPDGEVYVSWRSFGTGTNGIYISKSTDAGTNWTSPQKVRSFGTDSFSAPPIRITRMPVTSVSHAPGSRGKVFVTYHEDTDGFNSTPVYPGATTTSISDVNKFGHMVGFYRTESTGPTKGFLYKDGEFIDIEILGATTSSAQAINDLGQIVGSYSDADGGHLFTYFAGEVRNIDLDYGNTQWAGGELPVYTNFRVIRDMNNNGQIIGTYDDLNGVGHGFALDIRHYPIHPDAFRTIDYPGSGETIVFGINDKGKIVGSVLGTETNFIYNLYSGVFTDISLPGGPSAGINNEGEIAGICAGASCQVGSSKSYIYRRGILVYLNNSVQKIANDGRLLASTTSGGGGRVYGAPLDQDIFLARSSDGGTTWRETRINDFVAGDQFIPWMCTTSNGRIHVAWLDRRDDGNNHFYSAYYATSSDGGRTFSKNYRVNPAPGPYFLNNPNDASFTAITTGAQIDGWLGEYMGLACSDEAVYPVWVDLRNSNANIYTAKITTNLIDNGDFTITETKNNRMWSKDALLMHTTGYTPYTQGSIYWNTADAWASKLDLAGYHNWRLPYAGIPVSSGYIVDDTCDNSTLINGQYYGIGYNCIKSELGHLYYESLGNVAGGPITNAGGFKNWILTTEEYFPDPFTGDPIVETVTHVTYWLNPSPAYFNISNGEQDAMFMIDAPASAWPVRKIVDINTGFGNNVIADLGSGVTLEYDSVIDEGGTSIEVSSENPGEANANFRFLGNFYEVDTTANYDGSITLCLSYADEDLLPGEVEADIAIYHLEENSPTTPSDDQWVDVTDRPGYPDTVNNRVCGTVASLSWFAAGVEEKSDRVWIILAIILLFIFFILYFRYIQNNP